MDHTLESYLKRQTTEALLLILSSEKNSDSQNLYPQDTYTLIRKILRQRQVPCEQ